MMPLKHILEHAQKMRVIDIEEIAGLLEYHNRSITVHNDFSSDCGDRWSCRLCDKTHKSEDIFSHAPSLRTTVLNALEELEKLETLEKLVVR